MIMAFILSVNCLYSSEDHIKVNQDLLNLIEQNRFQSPGGKYFEDRYNLPKIQRYLIQNASQLKINNAFESSYVREFHTPLTFACKMELCSSEVVRLLCGYGANPNEKSLASRYPGTECLLKLVDGLEAEQDWKIDNQKEKFNFLKESCKNNGIKLLIQKAVIQQILFDEKNDWYPSTQEWLDTNSILKDIEFV